MKRYQIHSEDFIRAVVMGDSLSLDLEKLEIFEKSMPKAAEVQKLREAILSEGFSSFEEALKEIRFGQVEAFMIKLAQIEGLE